MEDTSVREMWERFTELNPEHKDSSYDSWHFCNTKKCAHELALLVISGIKKATCSLY
ncbi:MAG: hypothetical protein JSS91_14715 [Bacteroidetes bacterium]|nr:hypothetical protein [Bacteroidota bacterium]